MPRCEIDIKNEILRLDVSEEQKKLTNKAFNLFFRLYILNILDTIESHEGDLSILNNIAISFGCDVGELFSEALKEYLAIKKKADSFYYKPFSEVYYLELFPFNKVAPNDKKFHRSLKKILLKNLSLEELSAFLKGSRPNFYKESDKYAKAILKGLNAARRSYRAISVNVFYFEYAGVLNAFYTTDFSKKHRGSFFHLNEILELDNGELNPVLLFGGGFEDTFSLEPDPTYQI